MGYRYTATSIPLVVILLVVAATAVVTTSVVMPLAVAAAELLQYRPLQGPVFLQQLVVEGVTVALGKPPRLRPALEPSATVVL